MEKIQKILSNNNSIEKIKNSLVKSIKPTRKIIIDTEGEENVIVHCKPKSSRTSVEFNGTEMVFALLQFYDEINNYQDLTQLIDKIKNKTLNDTFINRIMFNTTNDVYGYINDICKKEKTQIINKFISNYKTSKDIDNIFDFKKDDIDCVFISGKTNKHTEINELNKNINKLEAKSDVYIKLNNGKFVGISVKQSRDATKSNYSVQKMLGKENDKLLTNIRKSFLNSNGFTGLDKSRREEMNKLFYNSVYPNPYWSKLRELILENKPMIVEKLVTSLYSSNVDYDMYEFNGSSFVKLNKKLDYSNVLFDEHEPYYFDNKGEKRNAAKLFYRLVIEEKKYRVEIRWKGDIYNSSPQFQIHEE